MRVDQPRRKQIRLPTAVYSQTGMRALLTIVVEDRQRVFEQHEFAIACIDLLRDRATHDKIGILAYCLMPDHLHLLTRVDGTVSVIRFVQAYKSLSTRLSRTHGQTGHLWQRSFHDHLFRETDDEREAIRYVLANPVRAGLSETWHDYPFSGSFTYNLTDLGL
jgi:REP element-mobilizing transposase RayT